MPFRPAKETTLQNMQLGKKGNKIQRKFKNLTQ